MTVLTVLQVAFAGWITWDGVRYLRSGQLQRHATVFMRRTPAEYARTLGLALALGATTFAVGYSLYVAWPSVMSWTWLKLIAMPADGPVEGQNLNLAAVKFPWFGALFLLILALNMPRLVRREEEVFRRGTKDWRDAVPRSLKFGMIHCLVGVPVSFGLALAIPGLVFSAAYLRGGIRASAFLHTVYNLLILSVAAFYILKF